MGLLSLQPAPYFLKEKEMLTEICHYLKNWFDFNQSKFFGKIKIEDGSFELMSEIQEGQYYRIVGSVFNDGVHKRGEEELTDETFDGAIWLMAIPAEVIQIAGEIKEWMALYGTAKSQNMSPYQSESFRGYSYSKASGGSSGGNSNAVPTWQSVFGSRLVRWRKV